MEPFRYHCSSCGQVHEGMPSFGFDYPGQYLAIPEAERAARTEINSDACIIDGQWFYIRVRLELPVQGHAEPFVWGVWVSVSEKSFGVFLETLETPDRDKTPPFFAWLTDVPPEYPPEPLKTMVRLCPYPTRPFLELEPTGHPLAIQQREGISPEYVEELAAKYIAGYEA